MNEREKEILKDRLREYTESITQKSKGKNMFICPLCGSGSGKNGTGAFSITDDGKAWRCFSCNKGGDIFDLIKEYEHIDDYNAQLKRASELFNVDLNTYTAPAPKQPIKREEPQTDFTAFFLEANKNLDKTDYHRGITKTTLDRFNVGYAEKWRHPRSPAHVEPTPRLIIPTSNTSYIARDTRKNIPEYQKQYSKQKVGSVNIFNQDALGDTEKPIFVVEGEIDALSIIDVGGQAVALGSTTSTRKFIEIVEIMRPIQTLVLALDNDKAGKRATLELMKGLDKLNVKYVKYSPSGAYKDPNEALNGNREVFTNAVNKSVDDMMTEEVDEEKQEYLKISAYNNLQGFIDGIADSVNTPPISTGYSKLDELLDGGLYEGLHLLGALSSLGKTTLALQMADQIAQNGQDVLIFSLEMARTELMAKSISRHTILEVLEHGGDTRNAKTHRGITTGKRYEHYSQLEKDLINTSILKYKEYASHIFISEGIGNIGAREIGETVEKHIRITGSRPVVIIDYLQILAPEDVRASDKQNIDKAMVELKRISRDNKIPIIAISSFNRASYKNEVGLGSFKESGNIEYGGDVLLGLQLKGTGQSNFDEKEARRGKSREMELIVLKNRNGISNDKIDFIFYPPFNYFKEC